MSNKHFQGAHMSDKVLRLKAVQQQTGKSRSAIYHDIKSGLFPRQIRIGRRAVGWLESEISAWLHQVVSSSSSAASDLLPPGRAYLK
jgi:prophage regulatory protein